MDRFVERQKGELSALAGAALWALFPVLTAWMVTTVPPLRAAALSTAFATLFFAAMLTLRGRWAQVLRRDAWREILLATLFVGVVFYALLFIGYRFTSPGNGAVVSLMEVFFSFAIVSVLWKHEPFDRRHAAGAALMVAGAAVILLPGLDAGWRAGDTLILAACAISPVGNVYAQRALRKVSAETVMFIRSLLSAPILLLVSFAVEPMTEGAALTRSLPFLLINGALLLGLSKIFWLEAIQRITITKTISISTIEVSLTLLFAFLLLHQPVTGEQILGLLPMVGGMVLLLRQGSGVGS